MFEKLTEEFDKRFTVTNLKYMRQFYIAFPNRHALRDQLRWTHYCMLLKIEDEKARYTKDADVHLIIAPEYAEVVKRIYSEYLSGKGFLQIKRSLEADGILNAASNEKCHENNIKEIRRIIRNFLNRFLKIKNKFVSYVIV